MIIKLSEQEKIKVKQFTKKLVESRKLNEAFVSNKLRQFASELASLKKSDKLLKGVQWDQIPDSEIETDMSETRLKTVTNNPFIVVIWFSKKSEQVKDKVTWDRRYGGTRDQSSYLQPGRIVVTQGRDFLYGGYSSFQQMSKVTKDDRYNKPVDPSFTVGKLRDFPSVSAMAIARETLEKYNADPLRSDRKNAKDGASALLAPAKVLANNIARYKKIMADNKFNEKTSETDKWMEMALPALRKKINDAIGIGLEGLLTFSKEGYRSSQKGKTLEVPYVDKTKIDELDKIAQSYRDLVSAYDWYLYAEEDVRKGFSDRTQERKEELKNKLKQLGLVV